MPRNGKSVSTGLQRIAEIAKQDSRLKFTSLAHLLTPSYLKESFKGLNRHAAPGIDGITMEDFRGNLDVNIDLLWQELRGGKYRATSVRRVHIPKGNGKLRPLGIPTVKDRTVQRAVADIIQTIYEPYFCNLSYGFRPGRSAHDALEDLRKTIDASPITTVVDFDIEAYFDSVNHEWLMKFLRDRISDTTLLRLIGKWLAAGIMENGVVARSEDGTPQGGPISPILANIYLHYVLDLWFEQKFKSTCQGACSLVRYADDFVVCFAHRSEAERFLTELRERFAAFGLKLSEEKTRLVTFGKQTSDDERPGPPAGNVSTFDFLGFTHYMRRRPKRGLKVAHKPCRKSRNKFLAKVKIWIEANRDLPVQIQAKVIGVKLRGYYNYFGLRHCLPALGHVKWHVERLWISALRRRSQRHRLYWNRLWRLPWFVSLPEPKLCRRSAR
jgi:RNA-directed DNA polymerase